MPSRARRSPLQATTRFAGRAALREATGAQAPGMAVIASSLLRPFGQGPCGC